jgi:cell division protein FtsB
MPRPFLTLAYLSALLTLWILAETRFSSNGYPKQLFLKTEVEKLQQENADTLEHIQRLENDIEALQHRTDMQEHVVRSELGYVRPQDIVLIFNTP